MPRFRTCRSPTSAAQSAIAASGACLQLVRASELVPAREGTDAKLVAVEAHASEIEASDVDQDARPNDPQLQDGKERLPACERLRIGIGEGSERVVERRRSDVLDCCGDHAVTAARIESTIDW